MKKGWVLAKRRFSKSRKIGGKDLKDEKKDGKEKEKGNYFLFLFSVGLRETKLSWCGQLFKQRNPVFFNLHWEFPTGHSLMANHRKLQEVNADRVHILEFPSRHEGIEQFLFWHVTDHWHGRMVEIPYIKAALILLAQTPLYPWK